jgi:hypothetical protein
MRRRAALAAAVAVAGCGGGADRPPAPPAPPHSQSHARLIRGWLAALNAGDYESAASFFARGAIVEQVGVLRLRSHAAAVAFNRSLPCKGRVTDVKEERDSTLAAFSLRPGRGGGRSSCDDGVRVRFRFRRGKFVEWRQLPQPAGPSGQLA